MIKDITIGDISIDCKKPVEQQTFYADLTGWDKQTLYDCPALVAENERKRGNNMEKIVLFL